MLAIVKNEESNRYSYYTLNGVDKEDWLKSMNGVLPPDIIGILNDDDLLYEKIVSNRFTSFEPVIENGDVVDIRELETDENTEEIQISQLLQNLSATDYKVIKNMEVLMLTLQKEYNIELPYEPNELHEIRQGWRDEIEQAESMIMERESSE